MVLPYIILTSIKSSLFCEVGFFFFSLCTYKLNCLQLCFLSLLPPLPCHHCHDLPNLTKGILICIFCCFIFMAKIIHLRMSLPCIKIMTSSCLLITGLRSEFIHDSHPIELQTQCSIKYVLLNGKLDAIVLKKVNKFVHAGHLITDLNFNRRNSSPIRCTMRYIN